MIGHLSGMLALVREGEIVIDCGGVGYRVQVAAATLAQLPEVGERVRLATHLAVRDDALTLFGFCSDDERELFEELLAVSGVGPRVALGIVGTLPPHLLTEAIANGDEARLTTVPGVGKRLAQRLIVELGDKIGQRSWAMVAAEGANVVSEVVEALTGLGFTMAEARRAARLALQRNGEEATLEQLVRDALRITNE